MPLLGSKLPSVQSSMWNWTPCCSSPHPPSPQRTFSCVLVSSYHPVVWWGWRAVKSFDARVGAVEGTACLSPQRMPRSCAPSLHGPNHARHLPIKHRRQSLYRLSDVSHAGFLHTDKPKPSPTVCNKQVTFRNRHPISSKIEEW
jgi:hypothetical protein